MTDPMPAPALLPLVLVTGPSGAGRSTAIRALEDLGFEAIDNLPLRFVEHLLDTPGAEATRPLALGIDARNRDFSTDAMMALIGALATREGIAPRLLYLDCAGDVLIRRFSETRRRHPLAPSESPEDGIARELALLAPIRERADTLIDTSALNVHELREEIERWFMPDGARPLAITVQSFSYKRGLPRATDMVFDCRFLSNPHWQEDLRHLTGQDAAVAAHVRADPRFAGFFDRVLALVADLLPAFRAEGKSHLSIGFGCTGGQHRSVTLAEALGKALAEQGQQVSIRHREIQPRAAGERNV